MDLFNKYISDVNRDLNGDSTMDYDDRWGYFSQYGNSYMMYYSGGGRVVELDKNGDFVLSFNSEHNIELAIKSLQISIDKTKTLMADQLVADNGNSWPAASAWFASGGSLMRSSVFEPVPRDYRAMNTDFGVLPYPKFDENQDKYYTLAEEHSWMLSVPVTTDAEFAGLILESLAAESVSTVTPAYYDVCLNGKSVRDEESKEMLDIIFANKIFDIGLIGSVGNFKSMLVNLEKSDSADVASAYASALSAAQTKLEQIAENFDKLD